MSSFATAGNAALLVQGTWRTGPSAQLVSRAQVVRECSAVSAELRKRIGASFPSARVEGSLALAPLLLVRCEVARVAGFVAELRGWKQVARVEEVLGEPDNAQLPSVPLVPSHSNSELIVGFADLGRPDFASPLLRSSRGRALPPSRFSCHGEELRAGHPTAVLACFLRTLQTEDLPRCVFESLPRDAGPFAWLAALDRLLCRGAAVVNLSYGRLALEREMGWGALEWGTELLCQSSGAVVVAAAGRLDTGLRLGEHLYLPASAPHVLAADGRGRTGRGRAKGEGEKVLLASRANPTGGRPGSSYSAPRIVAKLVDALCLLPEPARDFESLVALLLASARPHALDALSPGSPDRTRLRRIVAKGNFIRGTGSQRLELAVEAGIPLRVALVWRDSERAARLLAPSGRRLYRLRKSAQWIVMDVLPGDSRFHLRRVGGQWAVAWSPLSKVDLSCLRGFAPLSQEHSLPVQAAFPPQTAF